VPIEPDGSVVVTVPPNVAFQVDVVEAQMSGGQPTGFIYRTFPLHRDWLQLLPGETLSCNGCHNPSSNQQPSAGASFYSHNANPSAGSSTPQLFASIWGGAAAAGAFPGTSSGNVACQPGQTMAEALADCIQPGNMSGNPTGAPRPSVNVEFTDNWFGGGAGNEPFILTYDDTSFTTPLPTKQACALPGGWSDTCRAVINYPSAAPMTATVPVSGNIEPLWDKCRPANNAAACPTSTTAGPGTCSVCHSGTPSVANGYLDLADGASANNNNVENSYEQLMNPFSVTTTDPTTGATTTTQVRGAEFGSGNAAGSHFFQFFANPDATHAGLLSPAEMRLLSEWVDIGAQYFNNPFNATVD
jgi:hypothetical protein